MKWFNFAEIKPKKEKDDEIAKRYLTFGYHYCNSMTKCSERHGFPTIEIATWNCFGRFDNDSHFILHDGSSFEVLYWTPLPKSPKE